MKKIILGIFLIAPSVSFAQMTVKSITNGIVSSVGRYVMPVLFSAALAYFIWGVVTFIRDAENPAAREKGKQHLIWGILALFAMVAYLGLTTILTQSVFGTNPFVPQFFTK